MFDAERLAREMVLSVTEVREGEQARREKEAYFRGVDAARKEIAVITLVLAVCYALIRVFLAG